MSKGKSSTSNEVDPTQMAMYKDLYERSKGIAGQPFIPYTGPRVAGYNPDQLAGFDQTRSMFDQSMGYDPRGSLNTLANMQAPSLLNADLNAYQNPYTSQVVDNTLSDLDRARKMAIGRDQDQAIGAGAFGGSRSGILEAETNRAFADQAARTSANLRRSGFDRATSLAGQDIGRELDNRRFQSGLQQSLLGDQYRNLGLMSGIGGQQQGLQQAGMDAGYGEFMRALNYGPQQLGLLAQGISAMPTQTSQTTWNRDRSMDSLGKGASAIGTIMGLFSDIRLKDNVELIGQIKGHNVYTWDWNDTAKDLGVDSPAKGVIAQEVLEVKPDAVAIHDSGYLMVNYGAL